MPNNKSAKSIHRRWTRSTVRTIQAKKQIVRTKELRRQVSMFKEGKKLGILKPRLTFKQFSSAITEGKRIISRPNPYSIYSTNPYSTYSKKKRKSSKKISIPRAFRLVNRGMK